MSRYRAKVKCFVDNSLRDDLELADEEPAVRPSNKAARGGSDAVQGRA